MIMTSNTQHNITEQIWTQRDLLTLYRYPWTIMNSVTDLLLSKSGQVLLTQYSANKRTDTRARTHTR